MKTDLEIQKHVMEELAWEPVLSPTEIGVGVKNGIVTLSGSVKTYAEKIAAERAAQRVKGVKAVAIDLEVRLTRDGKIPDSKIAENVVQALEWHTSIPEDRIRVKVDNGFVYLEGEVDWIYQKTAAATAISTLSGIRGVENKITVRPLVNSENVKEKILQALERNADLEADNITVETSGTRVVLKGSARSWNERKEVERAAASAPGVTEVDDQLTIIN